MLHLPGIVLIRMMLRIAMACMYPMYSKLFPKHPKTFSICPMVIFICVHKAFIKQLCPGRAELSVYVGASEV